MHNHIIIWPLTFSAGGRVQCEVESCGCESQPPVLARVQVLLKELLRFIVEDEGQVPPAAFTPTLGTQEGTLPVHQLIARVIKGLLGLWAGYVCQILSVQ